MIHRALITTPRRPAAGRRSPLDLEAVRAVAPTVSLETYEGDFGPWREGRWARVSAATWLDSPSGLRLLDEEVRTAAEEGPIGLWIQTGGSADATAQAVAVLTRYQRWIERRNDASRTAAFEEAIARHFALHDLGRPLVRADLDHAIDTWRWLLRLDEQASAAVQLAALFHDVERLVAEPEDRAGSAGLDYAASRREHARRSARLMHDVLESTSVAEADLLRAMELVAAHEEAAPDDELTLLCDADALSFLSQGNPGHLDWHGEAMTREKIEHTLRRLSSRGRALLGTIGFRRDVARLVEEALRKERGFARVSEAGLQ